MCFFILRVNGVNDYDSFIFHLLVKFIKVDMNPDEEGLMDRLNSKIEELEVFDYENMESIKGALTSLWQYGLSGQALQTVRKRFNKINYKIIDIALFRFEEEYNRKKIKHPIRSN